MFDHYGMRVRNYPEGEEFCVSDGWGGYLTGTQDEHFVYRNGHVFPKRMTCGNYSTPSESPYAFGCHLIKGPVKVFDSRDGNSYHSDYDDRLRGFSPERWERARDGLSGRLENATLKQLSKFLSVVYDEPVECLQVFRGCNVGNGYPYLVFVSKRLAPSASSEVSV